MSAKSTISYPKFQLLLGIMVHRKAAPSVAENLQITTVFFWNADTSWKHSERQSKSKVGYVCLKLFSEAQLIVKNYKHSETILHYIFLRFKLLDQNCNFLLTDRLIASLCKFNVNLLFTMSSLLNLRTRKIYLGTYGNPTRTDGV